MEYKEAGQLDCGKSIVGQNEDPLLGELVNDNKDSCESSRGVKLFNEIHRYGISRTHGNGKWFEESVEFVLMRLDLTADRARVAVIFYEGLHPRPDIVLTNQFDGLVLTVTACKWMIVLEMQDMKSYVIMVWDIDSVIEERSEE